MEKIKTMIKLFLLLSVINFTACTNYHYYDGGLANGKHDCTVWEYLHLQPYDWDSTILMIEHAGMKEYFDGTLYPQITFFGITNYSIERFILDHDSKDGLAETEKWLGVRGIPADSCAAMLKKLIIPQKRLMMNDVPRGRRVMSTDSEGLAYYEETGGQEYNCVIGKMFCWTFQEDYHNVPEKGEISLRMIRRGQVYAGERIVSCNIEMTNGIVHALSYDFRLSNI